MAEETSPPPLRRGKLALRVLLGAALAAVAIVLILARPRPDEIEIDARFTPERPVPGALGVLEVSARPGPGAPKGARLERPRVAVLASPGLVFERGAEILLHEEDRVSLHFSVSEDAAPSEYVVEVEVRAGLVVEGQAVVRPAVLRRKITLTIAPAPAASAQTPDGRQP